MKKVSNRKKKYVFILKKTTVKKSFSFLKTTKNLREFLLIVHEAHGVLYHVTSQLELPCDHIFAVALLAEPKVRTSSTCENSSLIDIPKDLINKKTLM